MNAKFEKWREDLEAKEGIPFTHGEYDVSNAAWKQAIHSLEVTPMLKMLAYASFIHSTGRFENGLIDPLPEDMEFALNAFLNAIKEQAK